MRPNPRRRTWLVAAGLAVAGLAVAGLARPAGADPARTSAAIADDMDDVQQQLSAVLDGRSMSDPAARAAVAPKAIPLVRRQSALLGEMAAVRHLPAVRVEPTRGGFDALLYALADSATVARVDAAAAGTSADAAHARVTQLRARWQTATDVATQTNVVDALEKVDTAHPGDEVLTTETFDLGAAGATPELQERLVTLATETMKNPQATRLSVAAREMRAAWQAEAKAAATQAALVGHPLVLAGPTVGGKPFTTADYAGRVVLVDFWATWCVPCRAEMPDLLAAYKKYHGQGLEVVGVSSDYGPAKLTDYVAKTGLPWPQFFDAAAADAHALNPLTDRFGIVTLPVMFAIDRHGVCRSVKAFAELDELVPKLLAEK